MPAPNFANSCTPSIYFSGIDKNYVPYARKKWLGLGNQHTLRKQSTSAPCSELGQLEVTSQTHVFQIVEDDLKFGTVILWPQDRGEPREHSHSWIVLEVVGVIVFGWNKIVNHTRILFTNDDMVKVQGHTILLSPHHYGSCFRVTNACYGLYNVKYWSDTKCHLGMLLLPVEMEHR